MLRNLNDLNLQRAIHSNVDKMTYFSDATFWKTNKYFVRDDLGKFEYRRVCENGLLDKY